MTDPHQTTRTRDTEVRVPPAKPLARRGPPARLPRQDRPGRAWLVWPRMAWWLEVATVGAGYLLYEAIRALSAPRAAPALAHGTEILRAEAWLHLDPEVELNHLLNLWDPLSDAAGYYYSTLHFVVTAIVLVYLWWRHPDVYPRLRAALVTATSVALVVFVVWPVAPPRFTTPGVTDTLVQHHILGLANPHGITSVINQYAAMPSLHVGWAVWSAVAVVAALDSPWRHLAWVYPAATTLVVLATGNHYLFDAVGGAGLIVAALAVTRGPLTWAASPNGNLPQAHPLDLRAPRDGGRPPRSHPGRSAKCL